MPSLRRLLAPLVVLPAFACLFYPDIGELGGTAPTSDASTGDTGTSDVAKDSITTSDAGRFCLSSTHAFCADFDDGPVISGWTDQQLEFGGTITASTVRSVSPNTSAAVRMPRRGPSDPTSYVTLNKSFSGWKRVVVEFDMYLEAPSWATGDVNSGIVSVTFYSDNNDKGIAVSAGQGYTTVGTPAGQINGDPLPTDRWFHLRFDVDPSSGTKAVIDGKPFNDSWSSTPNAGPTMRISVGVSGYNRPAPEYRINYDNVTMDFP